MHTGLAYLSVLSQAQAAVGSNDPVFYDMVNRFIIEHFIRANLTVIVTLTLGTVWYAAAILSGKTVYPRWFVVFSPLVVLLLAMLIGYPLPAHFAGLILAPVSTWFLLIPSIANAVWLWNRIE